MSLRRKIIRLAYSKPELRPDLLPLLKTARETKELIRLKYVNTGDFGGTHPIRDSWVLEVKGPYEAMQPLIPTLKKYGLRYDRGNQSWALRATLYAYTTRKNENLWNWARKNQEQGYPVIKRLVEDYNRKALAENQAGVGDLTPKDIMQQISRHKRQLSRLEAGGIELWYDWPDRYSIEEARTWVLGNTYPFRDTMKKFGFRWGNGRKGKGWWIATSEFGRILPKWAPEIIRELPEPVEETATAVFDNMTLPELKKFLDPVAEEIWNMNEGYDGEYTVSDVFQGLMRDVRKMSPREQQDFYEKWK